jgi:hypothetical protein
MYTVLEENVYRLPDGKIWKGVPADLPVAQADLIAKAGKEYPTEWLKEQGALEVKKAPAKKKASAKKKAVKPVEDKSLKVEESKSEEDE